MLVMVLFLALIHTNPPISSYLFFFSSKFIHEWIFIRFSFCSTAHYSYMQACIARLLSTFSLFSASILVSFEILSHFSLSFFSHLDQFSVFRTKLSSQKNTAFSHFMSSSVSLDSRTLLCNGYQGVFHSFHLRLKEILIEFKLLDMIYFPFL